MIKRKSAERTDWQRVTNRQFGYTHLTSGSFSGVVTLLCIDAVSEPLWIKTAIQDFCVADAGYAWMQHFPKNENHVVTTMFNEHGQVIQWYIDIVWQHGVDNRGIPWWDDLYLDVIVNPDGSSLVLDEDELDAALNDGIIDEYRYQLAWDEANRVQKEVEQQHFPLLNLAQGHRQLLLNSIG